MNWKNYSHLTNSHAFLSASRYHWLNYSEEKLITTYTNHQKVALGTRYHNLAAECIRLAVRLPNTMASLNSFVNDAIGFKMEPEMLVYYSMNCYGTADAISYHNEVLRVHDLKTGVTPGSMNQLLIYAALFCLDYDMEPKEINLRIYQNDETVEFSPTYPDIGDIMATIINSDKIIEQIKTNTNIL